MSQTDKLNPIANRLFPAPREKSVRRLHQAVAAGDAGPADLFTGISRALDQALWFLEASA